MKSLATNKNDYVGLQIRVDGSGLRIQGSGPNINRSYGVAVGVSAPPQIVEWFGNQDAGLTSLANTQERYVAVQAAVRGDAVHFQVKGSKLNRDYGAAFSIDTSEELKAFVEAAYDAGQEEEEEGAAVAVAPSYDVKL